MAPPQHVQIISGAASAALFVVGLRNVFAPGAKIPLLPDADLYGFFHGTKKPDELVPGQRAYTRTNGLQIMTLAATKLCILFSNAGPGEGTFLRRNLFLTLGIGQVAGAFLLVAGGSEKAAKAAGASFFPTVIVLAGEGLVLLHDAMMRDRPVKRK